jgi:hypothetical protein
MAQDRGVMLVPGVVLDDGQPTAARRMYEMIEKERAEHAAHLEQLANERIQLTRSDQWYCYVRGLLSGLAIAMGSALGWWYVNGGW